MQDSPRVIDVYPYRLLNQVPKFLLLHRAEDRTYSGQWRMVGGKVEAGETAWEAGLRELDEETGLTPERYWTVPSLNTFYEWEADRVTLAPAFAAEVRGDVRLDAEHDAFDWVAPTEACDRLLWPEQQRLVRVTANVLRGGIPPSLIVDDRTGDV